MEQEKQMLALNIQQGQTQITPEVKEYLEKPTWEQVKASLEDDKMRGYKIDIETTATIFDDIEAERREISNFTQNLITMLNTSSSFIAQSPSTIDLMEQLTLLNLSNFKVGRRFSDSIKQLFGRIKTEITQASQQQEPVDMAAQAKMMKEQADAELNRQKAQIDAQKVALDNAYKNQVLELDRQKAMFDMQDQTRQTDIDAGNLALKNKEIDAQILLEQEKIRRDIPTDGNITGAVADLL